MIAIILQERMIQVSAYKDKNTGNWVATFRYVDADGNRKRKTKRGFTKKSEALEWERNFLANIHKPKTLDIGFKDFYKIYMNDLSNQLRDSTILIKTNMFENHLLPYFKNKKLSTIKPSDIIQWQNIILGKNLSDTYTRLISTQLRSLFNHAERYYDLKSNPNHKVKPIGKSTADSMNFWTKEEFDQFIDVVDDEIAKINYLVLFYTGMRIGELMAVTLKDLNLELGHIEINKTAQYNKREYTISKPKTDQSIRMVTIPRFLTEMLKTHIDKFYFIDLNEQVFLTTPHRLRSDLKKYARIAGVKEIRIHDFRHSHASLLIEQGVQPNIVQDRLGHVNIETTLKTYSHMYPNKQYQVAEFIHNLATNNTDDNFDENNRNPVLIPTTK